MKLRSCVDPGGRFVHGIHKPAYSVTNLREKDYLVDLGHFPDGRVHDNRANFPAGDVEEPGADAVFRPELFPGWRSGSATCGSDGAPLT